ncbi:MAG TPA: hypothetical protein PLB55_11015 [Prosthecobacter sp.]|nr:hypothetical protein [Prosthecobacter sp.]
MLDRLFDPANPFLTGEGVQMLAELRADPEEEARMEVLASKANEGTMTPEERREYESWVRAGSVMSILQAKARLYLKRQAKAA